MKQEFLDVVDENNNFTGEKIERSIAHDKGVFHRGVHAWIVDDESRVLLQKRSMRKRINPGVLTSSAAGHIESGSTPDESMRKEAREELGIVLRELPEPVIVKRMTRGKSYIENEFLYVYFISLNLKEEDITIQKDEVEKVQFMKINNFLEDYELNSEKYSHYGKDYWQVVFENLRRLEEQ